MKLFIGLAITLVAQVLVWFQINGQFKWEWFRDNKMLTSFFFAFPISVLFVYGTDYLYQAMEGKVWSVRLISFGSSILSFYIMSSYFLGERLDVKSGVCLALSLLIIIIQVLWK
jgi:hypothetical protein